MILRALQPHKHIPITTVGFITGMAITVTLYFLRF